MLSGPDLTIVSFTVPSEVSIDEPLHLEWVVLNSGDIIVSGRYIDNYVVSFSQTKGVFTPSVNKIPYLFELWHPLLLWYFVFFGLRMRKLYEKHVYLLIDKSHILILELLHRFRMSSSHRLP